MCDPQNESMDKKKNQTLHASNWMHPSSNDKQNGKQRCVFLSLEQKQQMSLNCAAKWALNVFIHNCVSCVWPPKQWNTRKQVCDQQDMLGLVGAANCPKINSTYDPAAQPHNLVFW